LRSETPIRFNDYNGPYYFFAKEGGPSYPIYGVLFDSISYFAILRNSFNVTAQPTDRMVKDWVYPTTRNNVKRKIYFDDTESLEIDTVYADVQIYVHEDGLHTTYFNGQLLPAEVFDSFPMTHGDYYVTQMAFYNEEIPELIRISNVNGFSAYVDEFGYNVLPAPSGHPEINDITKVYYDHHGASGCYYTDYPDNGIGLSPHNYDTVYRCLGELLDLMVEHNPDSVPVEWIMDGESHLTPGLSFLLDELTTHTVQCVLHYECPDTTTTFVTVVPPPLLTLAHDTTVCAGATLSVEQPNVISYLWSNGATTPSITVDSAGTYQVAVTNIGCRAESDSFHVNLYGQSAVDFGNDSILCELATLMLDATQPHPAEYLWQDNSTNTTYLVYQDGDYWVVVTDNCLGASDTIHIGYLSDFRVSLGPDTMLCEGKTLVLSPGIDHCNYLWQDGSTQPVYVVRGPGNYSVEVSNLCFSHSDAVNVDYEHCAQELYLPNAFTPDGNGLNEVFLPVFAYPDEVEEYRMEIYNRWGTLVFRSEEKTFGWDGANAPSGVYAYVVTYKTRGEHARSVTGNVTLVR
jgi:gliding motility-associated-like protein